MDNEELTQKKEELEQTLKSRSRRNFLAGLGKWSTAVIGVVVVGGVLAPEEVEAGWVNGRGGGGSWINRSGGGGAGWINGHGGGSWINRRGY